jgi:hypothetical protein
MVKGKWKAIAGTDNDMDVDDQMPIETVKKRPRGGDMPFDQDIDQFLDENAASQDRTSKRARRGPPETTPPPVARRVKSLRLIVRPEVPGRQTPTEKPPKEPTPKPSKSKPPKPEPVMIMSKEIIDLTGEYVGGLDIRTIFLHL